MRRCEDATWKGDTADVVRRILDAPTSATVGEGYMKGQMIVPPIVIRTARRAP